MLNPRFENERVLHKTGTENYKTEMTLIRWVTDLDFRKTLKMYGSTKLPSIWAHFVRVNLSSIFRKGDIEESFSYTAIQSGILSVFILQILVRMSSSGVCMLKTLHGEEFDNDLQQHAGQIWSKWCQKQSFLFLGY